MTDSNDILDGWGPMLAGNQSLLRLQLEMALESRNGAERPVAETIAEAAEAAGADLIFVLPRPDGSGSTAVVRVTEEGLESFLEVGTDGKRVRRVRAGGDGPVSAAAGTRRSRCV